MRDQLLPLSISRCFSNENYEVGGAPPYCLVCACAQSLRLGLEEGAFGAGAREQMKQSRCGDEWEGQVLTHGLPLPALRATCGC